MKELIKLVMKRAPWPVALILLVALGYIVYLDDEARHAALMTFTSTAEKLDWAQTALIGVLAWIGNRVHMKLDDLTAEVSGLHSTMIEFDRDLRDDIQSHKDASSAQSAALANRVTVIEERCELFERRRNFQQNNPDSSVPG